MMTNVPKVTSNVCKQAISTYIQNTSNFMGQMDLDDEQAAFNDAIRYKLWKRVEAYKLGPNTVQHVPMTQDSAGVDQVLVYKVGETHADDVGTIQIPASDVRMVRTFELETDNVSMTAQVVEDAHGNVHICLIEVH